MAMAGYQGNEWRLLINNNLITFMAESYDLTNVVLHLGSLSGF